MGRQGRDNRGGRPTGWKLLFIILAAINIVALLTVAILIFWPVKETPFPAYETKKNDSSEFIVRTTKKNVNEMIAAYLENVSQDNKYNFKVQLDEDVHLTGDWPVFQTTIPLSVHLEPLVQDNGDVILKLKTISVGLLELPNKRIMSYIREHLPMPEWVQVDARSEEIYIALTQMELKSNFHVRAAHIDLPANNIAFKFTVPYDTIGLD